MRNSPGPLCLAGMLALVFSSGVLPGCSAKPSGVTGAPQAPPANAPMTGELASLLKEREALAKKFYVACTAAYNAETVTLDLLIGARRELLEAELDLATGSAAKIKVLERHVDLAKQVENKIEALYKAGARGGEVEKHMAAKLDRVKLQIDLERLQQSSQVKQQ